jgi:endonuclease/exonuclease/phosphatase family metal-dependent hydrolase
MAASIFGAIVWFYALFVVGWFVLNRLYGDRLWWMALLNPFAALFFIPLPLFLVAWVWVPVHPLSLLLALAAPTGIFLWLYAPYFWPNRRTQPVTVPPGAANEDNAPSGDECAQTFTIMTFNLWWRSQARTTARVPLTDADEPPDVVAVQELMPHLAELLHDELAVTYPHRHFDVGEEMAPPRRLGVLSRHPLTPLDASHLVQKDFRIQIVRVHWPPQPFLLYNIHPRATLIVRYLREEGPLARKVRRSFRERARYFQLMLADIAHRSEPVLVVGDFNSADQSDAYRLMAQQLTDAHRAAGWGFGHTFPMHGADLGNLPLPTRLMRLDMIFSSAGLVAQQCRVGRAHGESDHLPVVATFHAARPQPAVRHSADEMVS